jgi:hypothetical protein
VNTRSLLQQRDLGQVLIRFAGLQLAERRDGPVQVFDALTAVLQLLPQVVGLREPLRVFTLVLADLFVGERSRAGVPVASPIAAVPPAAEAVADSAGAAGSTVTVATAGLATTLLATLLAGLTRLTAPVQATVTALTLALSLALSLTLTLCLALALLTLSLALALLALALLTLALLTLALLTLPLLTLPLLTLPLLTLALLTLALLPLSLLPLALLSLLVRVCHAALERLGAAHELVGSLQRTLELAPLADAARLVRGAADALLELADRAGDHVLHLPGAGDGRRIPRLDQAAGIRDPVREVGLADLVSGVPQRPRDLRGFALQVSGDPVELTLQILRLLEHLGLALLEVVHCLFPLRALLPRQVAYLFLHLSLILGEALCAVVDVLGG